MFTVLHLLHRWGQHRPEHRGQNQRNLQEIVRLDDSFLVEYLDFCSRSGRVDARDYDKISIVWQLDHAEKLVSVAFDFICQDTSTYRREGFVNAFFNRFDSGNKERYIQFLWKYLENNAEAVLKIEAVFYCIRHLFPDKFEETLLNFLEKNDAIETFTEISWIDNYYFTRADVIINDLKVVEYQKMLDVLDKIKKQPYKYAKHRAYINECINRCKNWADEERKRRFLNGR